MKTDDFDYDLPDELIAYYPLEDRAASNLLVLDRSDGSVIHKHFFDLPDLLREDDLLVLNNTKVIPARLKGSTRERPEIDVLLVRKIEKNHWEVLLKKPRVGLVIRFANGISGKLEKSESNVWSVKFDGDIEEALIRIGDMPLPPYIQRTAEELDRERYQTVYAETEGAIAAPTAGLHFTDELFGELHSRGIETTSITLHVGIGTFRPVKSEDVKDHRMHSEFFQISESAAESVNQALKNGRRVIAVGTTVVRALESAVMDDGFLTAFSGSTEIFITPPYNFRVVNGLITNFHLPKSTLLMLVSAFAGMNNILNAYETAKNSGYRFLSYGDAMFIA